MAAVDEGAKLLESFKKFVESGDEDGAKSASAKLKLKCIEFTPGVPALASKPGAQKEWMIVRDSLETAVLFAVKLRVCDRCRYHNS